MVILFHWATQEPGSLNLYSSENWVWVLLDQVYQWMVVVMDSVFLASVFFRIMWPTWCQKIQKLLARNLLETHAKVNFSPDRCLVASIWACYPILRNSIVALMWQRAYFGVGWLFTILWKSVSCSLIQHCSSLGDLHVVLLTAWFHGSRLMSWGFWHGHCWFAWHNLIENQQKVWQSCSHWLFSAWCHGSELGWLLGSGLCG